MAKTGRRPGTPETRAHILRVARDQFAERGYTETTIRSVAEAARVHPALLHHYFGTKQQLYREALDFPVDPWAVLDRLLKDTALEDLAAPLVRHFVRTWRDPDTGAWLRASTRQVFSQSDSVRLMRNHWDTVVLVRIAATYDLPQKQVAIAIASLFGVTLADSYIGLAALQELDDEELVAIVAPVVDRCLRPAP
ncbi:TetR/AcrR family transcriptional regulator [Humibacillus xanthopallidus]|uniref:TetR family transcriptional regulator n=1 Tax=Humibacillus xanthopallidus TaxID=412689 RepID=A0A543HHS0_9MICO|nr:TetR/AcrR family transcriptional regulator [Humibacillus xanthopallidus]TQM57875.1 TetR family transcriptional regulator [Humibacillus xanthopallidus]